MNWGSFMVTSGRKDDTCSQRRGAVNRNHTNDELAVRRVSDSQNMQCFKFFIVMCSYTVFIKYVNENHACKNVNLRQNNFK